MFSLKDMPASMTTLFSAYASITTFLMLIRTLVNELLPSEIRSYLLSLFHYFFTTPSSSNQLTLIIDQESRFTHNQIYEAATVYLRTKTSPSTERLKVSKTTRQKNVTVSIVKGETIIDFFENIELKWKYSSEREHEHELEKTFFELSFENKFKETVMGSYLPHVLATWVEIKEKEKVVKLYTRNFNGGDDDEYGSRRGWGSINLEHPVTFEKLAMDPELKQGIMDDLDRFVRRKKYYKSVGKAWKRGYLLYGPPGTGKSSLIAAMANYLKFDIYDLELSQVYNDSNLRRILMSTSNRSILAIEDIDCSVVQDRENGSEDHQDSNTNNKVTLSGMLNFIDGLWSSCGDERIFVFTTNHKDRLDPALLRPGRMDVHIHLSYCTIKGFKLLASNYLDIHGHHPLFEEIEGLIENAEVTPAKVAEELMKSDDADVAFGGLVNFLKQKMVEGNGIMNEKVNDVETQEA